MSHPTTKKVRSIISTKKMIQVVMKRILIAVVLKQSLVYKLNGCSALIHAARGVVGRRGATSDSLADRVLCCSEPVRDGRGVRGAAGHQEHLAVRGQRARRDGGGAACTARRGGAPRGAGARGGGAARRARPVRAAGAPRRRAGTAAACCRCISTRQRTPAPSSVDWFSVASDCIITIR